jgi:hypothetical protein
VEIVPQAPTPEPVPKVEPPPEPPAPDQIPVVEVKEVQPPQPEATPMLKAPEKPVVLPQPLRPMPDAEDAKARAVARVHYFAPAGYTPFGARRPKLIAPASGSQELLGGVADAPRKYFSNPLATPAAESAPRPAPGVLVAADPATLSLYLLGREGDPRVAPQWDALYLKETERLARAIQLREASIENWLAGKPPWNIARFYAQALELAPHAGTALLLCHNVARAFARGGSAIRWIKTDRRRGEYFDGARTFAARVLHPEGVLSAGPFGTPSLFHLLFSSSVFGTADPGDWPRYFASAALAWYAGAAAAPTAPADSEFGDLWVAAIERTARQMGDAPSPAERAWRYASADSFLELSRFGRAPDDNRKAARVQLAGAVFGLTRSSLTPPAGALWHVPRPGGEVDVEAGTIELLDVTGNRSGFQPVEPKWTPVAHSINESFLKLFRPGHVICTGDEGIACRYAAASWGDPALQSVANALVDEIGWNFLEHAVRRQASLLVAAPESPGDAYRCELDLGGGYQPCQIVRGA